MQYGFYFDQTKCIGCYTCAVACKDWHDIEAGPVHFIKVSNIEKGMFPNVFVAFLAGFCYHCADPSCIQSCPAGAIYKRQEDGIVLVDKENCLGKDMCRLCEEACPYGVPQFGSEENARMQKCDLCRDRVDDGLNPICVEACRTRALDAGPIDELKTKYGDVKEAVGFTYSKKTGPSIVFRKKGIGEVV